VTITRLQIGRSLGWLGVAAFFGICFLDPRLQEWSYGWLAYPAIPITILMTVLAIKAWGGEEALNEIDNGVVEALVSFISSVASLALLLFVGVLVFLFGVSLWSLLRS
jgi:hypothetical protein